ncbi:glutamate-1-semialdehyde 2,1-aminomutase [Deferribacter abyssi]|uniref:glutamate-1-semialdehyde 2,1-aminomutase n=1 Tax=Deferribacter abyssi TaxID=213806 RepID=UPI003C271059
MNIFEESKKFIPGGVNSPVRAFGSVGGEPIIVKRGEGSKIYDIDGNGYIDYVGSWGPLILGHCNTKVVKRLKEVIENGTSFGAPTELELELAKLVVEYVPTIEMVRMVNSGTEAVMSAIRLARAYTNRKKIIKFEGCYHGHSDSLLVKAGSGALTFNQPSSPGVPEEFAKLTLIADYNDIESVKNLFMENKGEIACVIIEPVAGNMGVVLPKEGFLKDLEQLCKNEGSLLIFDEIITGFRLSKGGAQEYFGINPDLTTLGKIIGGGLPVGAYGGRKDIMEMVSPVGPVYQAGTLSGNPLAMAAGIETLKILGEPAFYDKLRNKASKLWEGFNENLKKLNLKFAFNSIESMASMFFIDGYVKSFKDAIQSDTKLYAEFFHKMLAKGVNLAPSQFEAMFVSIAHSDEDLEVTIKKHYETLKEMFG